MSQIERTRCSAALQEGLLLADEAELLPRFEGAVLRSLFFDNERFEIKIPLA